MLQGIEDSIDACDAELGVERERNAFGRHAIRLGQVALCAPSRSAERRLAVSRDRVMDTAGDAALAQTRQHAIALGMKNDEQMPRVLSPRLDGL